MGKLTTPAVEKIKVRGVTDGGKQRTRLEYHDGGGLYLIVQKSGHKSWAQKYKRNGVSQKLTLGPYDAKGSPDGTPKVGDPLSLVEARALNTQIKLQRNCGVEPHRGAQGRQVESQAFVIANRVRRCCARVR